MNKRRDLSVICIFGLQSALLILILLSFCLYIRTSRLLLSLTVLILALFAVQSIFLWIFFFREMPSFLRRLRRKVYGEEEELSDSSMLLYPVFSLETMLTKLETEDYNPYKIKMLQMQAEFRALQRQISPHFLYNTLETIRSKAYECGSRDIMNIVESLAMLFRFRINRAGEMATFNEELDYVHHYMTITRYRFGELYRMHVDCNEADVRDCLLPVLTLAPIVENAIFRGLEPRKNGGEVQIKVITTQKRLIISVSDNGVGMDSNMLTSLQEKLHRAEVSGTEAEGIPANLGTLENLHQRIQYYFGSGYGLHISSTPGIGTTVEVMLPKL